jgi:biotin carboxylase
MIDKDIYILFIGLGDWYLPYLKFAKEAGFKTVVTNRDIDSVTLNYADIGIVVDGLDVHKIISELSNLPIINKIKFVYTGTELFTSTSIIASFLGVPWHNIMSANIAEKKHLQRKFFLAKGLPVIQGCEVKSSNEIPGSLMQDLGEHGLVIKPSDGLSSNGVSIIFNKNEINSAFYFAKENSISGSVIVEVFISGQLCDVNGFITPEKFFPLGINDKKSGPLPYAVVVEISGPTELSIEKQQELYKIFEKSCRSIGLVNGPVKGDFIVDNQGKIHIMEIGARLHGPLGSIYTIPKSININPFKEVINFYTDSKVNIHIPDIFHSYKKVLIEAKDKLFDLEFDNPIVLRKAGKSNKKEWKSNNDVPYYVVIEE